MATFCKRVGVSLLSRCTPFRIDSALIRTANIVEGNSLKPLAQNFSSTPFFSAPGKASVTFKFADGGRKTVEAKIGTNLLDVVLDHDVDVDGFGACEGTLACSTCHVILSQEVYDSLAPPCDEELDMLDLAYDLTDTSRLGCQIVLTKELDGLEVDIPEGLSDARG